MTYRLFKHFLALIWLMVFGSVATMAADFGKPVTWDQHSLIIDGRRVCPVMGEIHYSRVPADEWAAEVRKMKEGGVTIIATYIFWNHIEEEEGVFRWDGCRNLRRFLEVCKQEQMPVVLRLGPFCHGEVRNGGIPDWMFSKGCRLREANPTFMHYCQQLYRQIFEQVEGLQWKDGGPVIAAQFDNEYRGRGEYLMALKQTALDAGFDLPFYTRTGWPELATPVPFGEMIPLYGDYADGFWDKATSEGCGNYYKAFNFKAFRSSTAIGTDMLGRQEAKSGQEDKSYPYFTCELGGGMATAYHRRPYIYPEDAYSMALVKLGSGSNLLGYYMYHGGTNPEGRLHTLNECQTSPGTANNDLPVCTYDFQAPLGEFGQPYPQYYMLRPLHLFMQDYGELLAPMQATFPTSQDLKQGQDDELRWATRSFSPTEGESVESGFIFINNYERLQTLSIKKNVRLSACGVTLPELTIPSGTMAIFPVNIDGIRYATAQLVAKRNGKIYIMQVPGIPTTICLQSGKTLKNVKPLGTKKPVCRRSASGKAQEDIYLLSRTEAEKLFLDSPDISTKTSIHATCTKVKEVGPLRQIVKGKAKVAEAPSESDWEQAAVYKISWDESATQGQHHLLSINYQGDCARLYAKGSLIADNFYYGRPFLYGLWRLPDDISDLELRVLPLQKNSPIYLPREADSAEGEQVKSVEIIQMKGEAKQTISLAGQWDFSMGDKADYNDKVVLPGSMLTNGKGEKVSIHTQWTGSLYDSSYYFNPYMEKYRVEDSIKFPFFLTPERHYVGTSWYRRMVKVPKTFEGQQLTLLLERPHIETTLYVNGQEVGHQMSLSTPHRYDVTPYIRSGANNEIAIRVYNGIENVCVGQDSHSVTDQTQGNWNGIVGRLELQAQPIIWRKRVVPHLADRSVDIIINEETYHFSLGDNAELWDEFHPRLYSRTVEYQGKEIEVTFGLREISIEGRQLYINGRPLFLRGTVENCCFPETGYPPTEKQEWLRLLRKCKEYGLNHMRFHSYCPPEAAFSAADEVGIYLQVEGPSWPNHGVRLSSGQKIDQYLLEESKRIVDEYGHHPSFVMMAAGNEPAGNWVKYCNEWVAQMKQYDPTKIFAGASVGGGWAWDSGSEYHVKGGARGLDEWNRRAPSSDNDYLSGIEFPRNYKDSQPNQSPIVAHEQGQWCAFPDFREITQYTGVYKARNFELFQDLLRDHGMASQSQKFLMASGKLQVLCYKYEIERNLRTPDYAGFQLLSLNDYSGQGTALVGPLNVHWREKGYCNAHDWTQFCSPVVALARFPKFVFTNKEQLSVPVEVYNASADAINNASIAWKIYDDQQHEVAAGTLPSATIPLGKNHSADTVTLSLAQFQQPQKLTLQVQINGSESNQWDFWVYPAIIAEEKNKKIYETDTLDAKALKTLQRGGSVLLCAVGHVRFGNDVVHNYLPVFWNTSWFKMRPPHTTGAYIDKEHPLFKYDFPTDDWQDLNWWELVNRTQVMNLAELPADYQPVVQPIDTWHISRKLGMLIEARVGKGRLLMTTIDITNRLEDRPVARQLRHAILQYMQSADFQPTITVDEEIIRHLFERESSKVDMFTNGSPDELKPKLQ